MQTKWYLKIPFGKNGNKLITEKKSNENTYNDTMCSQDQHTTFSFSIKMLIWFFEHIVAGTFVALVSIVYGDLFNFSVHCMNGGRLRSVRECSAWRKKRRKNWLFFFSSPNYVCCNVRALYIRVETAVERIVLELFGHQLFFTVRS